MDFDISVEKTSTFLHRVTVTVAAAEVEAVFAAATRKVARSATLPGFRPGKVPASLVGRHFAPKIHDEVQEQLLQETLYPALEAHKLDPVAQPQVSLGVLTRGAIFTYTAAIEVRPEVVVQAWEGLHVPREASELPAGEVDAELEKMRREAAQMVPVAGRDVAQQGDLVLLDYEGTVDGVPFEGGRGEHAEVEIGAEDYIPGFAEGLVGQKVPGECDVAVRFPDNYGTPALAGKQASFHMRCHELKTRELPALDDEFARDVGEESLEALRAALGARLTAARTAAAEEKRRTAATEALVAANPLEVPPSMVRAEAERMVAAFRERIEHAGGRSLPLDAARQEEMVEGAMERASFHVKAALLLWEVGKLAGVEISEDDIDQEIEVQVKNFGEHGERLRAGFASAERREDLRYHLHERRTIDRLLERAVDAA